MAANILPKTFGYGILKRGSGLRELFERNKCFILATRRSLKKRMKTAALWAYGILKRSVRATNFDTRAGLIWSDSLSTIAV